MKISNIKIRLDLKELELLNRILYGYEVNKNEELFQLMDKISHYYFKCEKVDKRSKQKSLLKKQDKRQEKLGELHGVPLLFKETKETKETKTPPEIIVRFGKW